jgi:DNA-binding CsgD family transcriptional regulator
MPDTDDPAPLQPFLVGMAAVLLGMTLLVGIDLATDARSGAWEQVALDLMIAALSLGGTLAVTARLVGAHRRAGALHDRLRAAQGEAQRFREESRACLRGLAVAIDRQLVRWALSPAEREVALLLLKGLSLKEIASLRASSERTVRHQARAVYRKAGLAGRVELAAFFLEDLLVPASAPEEPERTLGDVDSAPPAHAPGGWARTV